MLARLAARTLSDAATTGRDLRERHRILGAGLDSWPGQRALRAVWAKYFAAADACGLLGDADIESRLTSEDDEAFRSALAECESAWFLQERGFAVSPRPDPPSARGVDLLAALGEVDVYVEVKAPLVDRLDRGSNEVTALLKCIKDAGAGQFKRERANLLIVVPTFGMEVYNKRGQLLKATIGEHALAVPISLGDKEAPEPYATFLQNGKLATIRRRSDGGFTTDLTRLSAVMSLEHKFRHISDNETEVLHVGIVVHNPFASDPIDPCRFGDLPQWVNDGTKMWWTDGYRGP